MCERDVLFARLNGEWDEEEEGALISMYLHLKTAHIFCNFLSMPIKHFYHLKYTLINLLANLSPSISQTKRARVSSPRGESEMRIT